MNELRWLMRAKRWAQHPPSSKRVKLVFGVIAFCLLLFAIERFVGVPAWMQMEREPSRFSIKP
ncbi:hypothetical protein [Celeribacter arenosi]|uniref:Uncharacterized protein n=1 Tax=Celeribacter arenosi TaxID=792649 RepID=A0ABP7KIR6_9RHOB